jgi:group I intron endonuclease
MYVYKTTNLVNEKIYIGISKKSSVNSPRYLGSGKAFTRAVTKYGRENFVKEIMVEDSEFMYKDLQRLEIFLINLFNAQNPIIGYNISKGGDGNDGETNGMFGKTHSKESVEKLLNTRALNSQNNPDYGKMSEDTAKNFSEFMSQRNKDSPTLPNGHSAETISRISNTMKQLALEDKLHKNHVKFTEERKALYSEKFSGENNPFFGKEHTQETKDKIRENIRLRFPSVNKLDFENNILRTYESITDVTLDGYRPDLVKKVLKGENKSHGGFYWKYV